MPDLTAEVGQTPSRLPCLGHEAVFERFRRIADAGRLGGAYLFVGDPGIGKRKAAEHLAAALLCESPVPTGMNACGACHSCSLIAAGAHPDFLPVARPEGRSTLPVELLIGPPDKRNREGLCHDVALKPYLGRRRVALIDDADHLSLEAGNCLLKTLEEPPPASVIFLIASSPARVLPTIRSRTQVIRFDPLDPDTVKRVLLDTGVVEAPDQAERLAAASRGSVARAAEAADDAMAELATLVGDAFAGDHFDPVKLGSELHAVIDAAADPASRRRRFAATIEAMVSLLRDQLRSPHGSTDATLQRLESCFDAQERLDRNANLATLLPWWLDRLWRVGA